MTRDERVRMNIIIEQTNRLMDAPAKVNPCVTNADVVEALLGDVMHIRDGRAPKELAALIERDEL